LVHDLKKVDKTTVPLFWDFICCGR